MPQPTRDQVFISYSHKDTRWRDDLEMHLKPYLRNGSVKSWSDKQIQAGSKWITEINTALTSTKVAVLLVSPDFITSDFIHEHELGPVLKKAEQGGIQILWVPIRDSAYKRTPLKDYQAAVLDPSKPLAGMTPAGRDRAWVKICEEIEKAVNKAREDRRRHLFVDQSRSSERSGVGQEVRANVQNESKRSLITSIEFTLECTIVEFDEEKFKIALKLATGIDLSQIRIASIRAGSTIVQIDGEQEALAVVIRTIRFSQQITHRFALQTGLQKIAWEMDGTHYELTMGDRTDVVENKRSQDMGPSLVFFEEAIGTRQQPTPPQRDQKAASRRRNERNTGNSPLPHSPSPLFYAIVALVAFLLGFVILSVMLWNAQLLVSLGLTGNFYYVLLLALGLSAAAFLFGLLQSHAVYSGHTGWGRLELGGAIVGCALVVVGGFYLVPNPLPFAVTVFVHGEGGIHDLVPKDSGEVVMELGGKVQRQQIGPDGTVDFKDIAPSHRGEAAPLWFESKQFESVHPEQKYALKGDAIQLEVRKKGAKLSGRAQDENGNPLSGVKIEVASLSTTTNSAGHFEIVIPGNLLQPELDLSAVASDYSSSHLKVIPNGNDVVIQLTRAR